MLPAEHLRKVVAWARERGTVVASDECYIELGFDERPLSVLHPDACGGSHEGLLAVHSLSKRSNMAGYRVGFVTGDPALVAELLEIRKQAGMIVPGTGAGGRGGRAQRRRPRRRAAGQVRGAAGHAPRPALEAAGWAVEHSQAGLYLWAAHPGRDCWESVAVLAEAGILVAPGSVYGRSGRAARPGRADRHRRADRRRRRAPCRAGLTPCSGSTTRGPGRSRRSASSPAASCACTPAARRRRRPAHFGELRSLLVADLILRNAEHRHGLTVVACLVVPGAGNDEPPAGDATALNIRAAERTMPAPEPAGRASTR